MSLPDAEISITQYGDRFLAGLFMEVRRATYEQPSEWDEVEAHDGSAESIAEWVIEKETQGCLARLNF